MKLSAFYKGLLMSLIGFIATMLSSIETISFAYVAIATSGFTVVYVVKNWAMPSISVVGIDLRDVLSGVILAAGMALSSYAAQVATIGFEWQTLWISVAGAVVGYFAKTAPSKAELKKSPS